MPLRTWLGGAACFVAVAGVTYALDGRHPVGSWLLVAPTVALAALGLLSRSWRLMWALPLPAVAVLVGAAAGNGSDPLSVFALLTSVSVAAIVLWPVGIFVGRRLRVSRLLNVAAGALLAGALVVPAVALATGQRTVRVHRDAPLLLDERTGSLGGVRLGDTRAELEARLGPGTPLDDTEPVNEFHVLTGPSSLEPMPTTLRYGPDLSFVLDAKDRVVQIWTTDRQVRTRRDVGVGDSMRLFERAYGTAECSESGIGSDWPIPFPECDFQIRGVNDRWLYVGGTYDRAGIPAAQLVLSSADLY